ncbi:MAG: 16S rRNA (cytosine(1402)-N(4))-methyltransferase RsmH [Candidatus Omnitrophota bacterium]
MAEPLATIHCSDVEAALEEAFMDTKEQSAATATWPHKPVMLAEVLTYLKIKNGDVVMDCTVGLGGHAEALVKKIIPRGKLLAMDRDQEVLALAQDRLKEDRAHCCFVHGDFRNLDHVLSIHDVDGVDAFLFDLGVSSVQLDTASRGFSFRSEGPLDMRMDRESFISAYDLLNTLTEGEIASMLWRFGQERFSRRIAQRIVRSRSRQPISSTTQLAEIVLSAMPYKSRFQRIHPATRTFQALRIAVNRELEALDEGLKKAALFLNKGGRICVISFHSLEDKIVKDNFRQLCGTSRFRLIFKKVLRPCFEEMRENPRSRSAKMRVIERVK